jgi:hypothetical protein
MFGVGVGVRVGGFTASSGGGFDPDAQAFFDRVTTAGGTLSETEKTATNTLVVSMKADGVWSAMKAIYPMVGASAAACAQNLKSSSFTGTFSSGWTFASDGATPNGTSAFMDSGLNASTNLSVTSLSFGGYTSSAANRQADAYHGAFPTNYLIQSFKSYGVTEFYTTTGNSLLVSGGTVGMVQANQLVLSTKIYTNSTIGASDIRTLPSLPNLNMYIGGANNNGTATFFDNHLISYYYYADGFTDTQASDHYTAVQAFQTTLGRAIAP